MNFTFSGLFFARLISLQLVAYQMYMQPVDKIDFSACTHWSVGAVQPKGDGSIDMSMYATTAVAVAWAKDVASRVRAVGGKSVLMVGGFGAQYAWRAAAAPAVFDLFVANLLASMDEVGCDGLDIDWCAAVA
jgi:chitinase